VTRKDDKAVFSIPGDTTPPDGRGKYQLMSFGDRMRKGEEKKRGKVKEKEER
jgi:hypothetical protein